MLLKSLKLKNFKCHKDLFLEFGMGIISICGENGIGKSSIIEAISWGLFNFLPYSDQKSIIKYGAKSAEIEIVIQSSLDNKDYLIRRRTSGQNAIVYDTESGSLILEGVTKLTAWVQNELNITSEIKLKSISENLLAVPQGRLVNDFLQTASEKKEIFDTILSLNDYKLIHQKLGDAHKILDNQQATSTGKISSFEGLETEISQCLEDISQKEIQQNTLNTDLKTQQSTYKSSLSEFENESTQKLNYLDCEKSIQSISSEISTYTDEIAALSTQLQEKESLEDLAQEYLNKKQIKLTLTQQKLEYDSLLSKHNELKRLLDVDNTRSIQLSSEIERIQNLQSKYDFFSSQLSDLPQIQQIHSDINIKLQDTLSSKPLLEQYQKELSDKQFQLETIQQTLLDIQSYKTQVLELPHIESNLDRLRSEYHEVESLIKAIEIHEQALHNLKWNDTPEEQLQQTHSEYALALSKLKDTNHELQAKIKFNTELIPKLQESKVCPLIQEKCLNLEKSQDLSKNLQAEWLIEKQSIIKEISNNNAKADELAKYISSIEKQIPLVKDVNTAKDKLNNRTLEQITEQGIPLKEKRNQLLSYTESISKESNYLEQLKSLQESISSLEKNILSSTDKLASLPSLEADFDRAKSKLNVLLEIEKEFLTVKVEIDKLPTLQSTFQEISTSIHNTELSLSTVELSLGEHPDITAELAEIENFLETNETSYLKWIKLDQATQPLPTKEQILLEKQLKHSRLLTNLHTLHIQDDIWFQEREASLKSLKEKITLLEQEIYANNLLLTEKNNALSSLRSKEQILETERNTLKSQQNKSLQLKKLRELFKRASIQKAKYYTSAISLNASNIFGEVMDNSSYEIEWTENYDIVAHIQGQSLSFESLSGGQQTLAALSIRLGLLKELSNLKFVFFDEPTAHLDRERCQQLALQLSSIHSFQQLFVITHDESFVGQTNHVIHLGSNTFE